MKQSEIQGWLILCDAGGLLLGFVSEGKAVAALVVGPAGMEEPWPVLLDLLHSKMGWSHPNWWWQSLPLIWASNWLGRTLLGLGPGTARDHLPP